jgi:hypothetical protein
LIIYLLQAAVVVADQLQMETALAAAVQVVIAKQVHFQLAQVLQKLSVAVVQVRLAHQTARMA